MVGMKTSTTAPPAADPMITSAPICSWLPVLPENGQLTDPQCHDDSYTEEESDEIRCP